MDGPFPPYRVHAPTRFERTNPCCEVSGAATISAFAGEFTSFHPGNTGSTFAVFDPASGIYEPLSTFDPLVNQGFDSGLKAPSTDQFSIGIEHEIARQSVVELTYVRKDARNSTGWQDITGVYGIDTAELPDGRTLTVFPLLTDPSESFFQLTNPSDFYLSYDGFVVALDRRWFRSWQGRISYSLSRASGLQASSIARPGSDQESSGGFTARGRDPNDFINAKGELPNDRTHMFRVQGVGEIPRVGLMVGASFQYLTGTPWAATRTVRLPQGPRSVFIEPRGSRRLPAQTLLDLRLWKVFCFEGNQRVELLVDVLNVFNETATEQVWSTNFFSPNFDVPIAPIKPRRAFLAVKLSF